MLIDCHDRDAPAPTGIRRGSAIRMPCLKRDKPPLEDATEQRELTSRPTVLIAHPLKWQFQPGRRGSSWQDAISTQGAQIARHMRKNPSLKAKPDDAVGDGHADARPVARMETGLEPEAFPLACPYTWTQIMDDQLLPDRSSDAT